MGACLSRLGLGSSPSRSVGAQGLRRKCGFRNEPLKKEHKNTTTRPVRNGRGGGGGEVPTTEAELRSKRDEFWHTAPAFEGRREVWDALRAAASALEDKDLELAQAIVDGAGVTLPHGTLEECYDELGNRYRIPGYCLAPLPPRPPPQPPAAANLTLEQGCEEDRSNGPPTAVAVAVPKKEFQLKVRLSTARDVLLSACMTDTVGELKAQLQAQEGIDAAQQRWYFFGKLLADSSRLQDTKFQKDFVVQVIIVNAGGY